MQVDSAVIGGVELIPLKGILLDLKPVVEEKMNGGEYKYTEGFTLPSSKSKFLVELVVDDECEVCPVAVEIVSELAARFPENINAKIYNITYVPPPFQPITATPAFRINNEVSFTGIPLNPDAVGRYFNEFFKRAYVLTHPKARELFSRLEEYGKSNGYYRNPNNVSYLNLIVKLLRNIDEYGYPYCPCRPLNKKPGMTLEEIHELNKDKVCPCIYAPMDIKTKGHCLCGLYWSKEKVDEYIKTRLEKYGWIIRDIDNVIKALEELKKRVVSGEGRMLAEELVNKMMEIYSSLPD